MMSRDRLSPYVEPSSTHTITTYTLGCCTTTTGTDTGTIELGCHDYNNNNIINTGCILALAGTRTQGVQYVLYYYHTTKNLPIIRTPSQASALTN